MLEIIPSNQFKKDLRLAKKRDWKRKWRDGWSLSWIWRFNPAAE